VANFALDLRRHSLWAANATEAMVADAARRREAHQFIAGLQDWHARHGYDAHVGERAVKLSGEQRRVALRCKRPVNTPC